MTKAKTKAPRAAYRKLTRAEAFAICKQLEKVIIDEGDESCSYMEGWDDARVVREVIPDYPGNGAQAVGALRVEVFGVLVAKTYSKDATAALAARVETLEREHADLRRRLGDLLAD